MNPETDDLATCPTARASRAVFEAVRVRPDPAAAESVSGLSRGITIAGKYRLLRHLARGGMGEVWLAEHEELWSEVAIKFIHVGSAPDSKEAPFVLERFRFEAQISARLSALTRHVVSVHDAGLHDGIPYLMMEYVPGITLEAELQRAGPFEPELVADVLDQAAEALEAAHSMGIVHRDLKPSNVMLLAQPDDTMLVKVADFGIAKALRTDLKLDRPRETAAGELVGSPGFMSPEQIRGTSEIDARSDLWSLGAVAYEVLTGCQCFEGDTVIECMAAISSRAPSPVSRMRLGLPRALDAWFARSLARDPEERFSSAREAADAFRRALSPAPRRRTGVIAATGALVVAAGVGVLALAGRSTGSAASPGVPRRHVTTAAVVSAAPAASPEPSVLASSALEDPASAVSPVAPPPVQRPPAAAAPRTAPRAAPARPRLSPSAPAPGRGIAAAPGPAKVDPPPPAPGPAKVDPPPPAPEPAKLDPPLPPPPKKLDPSEIQ